MIGRYELRTVGGSLENRSVFFQGIDMRTALRNAPTQDNIGGAGGSMMLGFTNRINEDVEIYITGTDGIPIRQTSVSTEQNVADNWIMPYGVRVMPISGTGENRFYTLRNL
jgi:hypothetical protein